MGGAERGVVGWGGMGRRGGGHGRAQNATKINDFVHRKVRATFDNSALCRLGS